MIIFSRDVLNVDFSIKPLALWSSVFLMANWVLGCVFIAGPVVLADKIFYFGVGLLFLDTPNYFTTKYLGRACINYPHYNYGAVC